MFRYKTLSITAILTVFVLLSFVNHSDAASITSFSVYANSDWGDGATTSAYVSADEDILFIDWYAKQTYPIDEEDNDHEYLFTSRHGNSSSVYVDLTPFNGHIKIAEYEVKAVVSFVDSSDEDATGTLNVYKPEYDSIPYKKTGIYGYSQLTAHYYDGTAIIMEGYTNAYNGIGGHARGEGKCRHDPKERGDDLEYIFPVGFFSLGESYGYGTSDSDVELRFFPGKLGNDNEWTCEAYIRIEVYFGGKKDDWLATSTNTFNGDDVR